MNIESLVADVVAYRVQICQNSYAFDLKRANLFLMYKRVLQF